MKERPIPFKGDMVRAVLSGQKTQTRRPMKPIPVYPDAFDGLRREIHDGQVHFWASGAELPAHKFRCPYGQPGDRLWVRERWAVDMSFDDLPPRMLPPRGMPIYYHATAQCMDYKWRPSIHMPRWASRITLEITDIRVERVQNIHEEDAIAEGIDPRKLSYLSGERAVTKFSVLWNSIYAADGLGWDVNPWVWVVAFKRVENQKCPKN